MNKVKMQVLKDNVQDFWLMTKIVCKVIGIQVLIVLVAAGVCYFSNFRVTIQPIVQTISPIILEK